MGLYYVLKRIIRNDAIKVDPPEIYNMRIIALACSVSNVSPYTELLILMDRRHVSLARSLVWTRAL